MKLSRIRIGNFKAFSSVELHLNPDLSILTGINNTGKTTVLEAISLWAECFQLLLHTAGRSVARRELTRGDYMFHPKQYAVLTDLQSVRSPTYADIFHNHDTKKSIDLVADLEVAGGKHAQSLAIGFAIRAARGAMYEITFAHASSFDYPLFNRVFRSFPEPIKVIHASPVAMVSAQEDFATVPKVRDRVRHRRSGSVLRNRLYQLKKNASQYSDFVRNVSYVLNEGKEPLEFVFNSDETQDTQVDVLVNIGARDYPRDISLLGSGTLQIVEVLLSIHEALTGIAGAPRDLDLILLDEPDSHIHRDIQRRLTDLLLQQATHCQIVATSHNESFLRSSPPRQIFHLQREPTGVYRPIIHGAAATRRQGLQPSVQLEVLTALGSESALDFLNALEAERLVLVEGPNDARYIQAIMESQRLPSRSFSAMYWSFNGIDSLLSHIRAYREVFRLFRNDQTLWDKAALVLDSDLLAVIADCRELQSELRKTLDNIPVYLWPAYTIEATILAEPDKLIQLLGNLVRRSRGSLTPAEETRIAMLVRDAIADLAKQLRARLDGQGYLESVFDELTRRRDQFDSLMGRGRGKHFIGTDRTLQPKYKRECSALLDNERVHPMAHKEHVCSVVKRVYEEFEVPFSDLDYFLELIAASDPSTRFDSWVELSRALA